MTFEFIKRYFPLKAHSLDEFMGIVEREGGVSVTAEIYANAKDGIFNLVLGTIANYEYFARFQSKTPRGRSIIFDEVYGSRYESEYSFCDSPEKRKYALKALLTADNRLHAIRERLPKVKATLVSPRGAMDEKTRQRMYEDAKKLNLTPFNPKVTA